MKKMGGNKGFTLVELIIVIAILAIIMLIAIPNFSGIQQRMKVRADKATAAQIGKAVRVWYTDYTTDDTLKGTLDLSDTSTTADATFMKGTEYVIYDTLTGIEAYEAKTYLPTSLVTSGVTEEHQAYAVRLSGATQDAKVVVAICKSKEGTASSKKYDTIDGDITEPTEGDPAKTVYKVNYDGTTPAIAYVEP